MSTDNATQNNFNRAKIVKNQIIDVMSSLKELSNSLPNKPDFSYESALQELQKRNCVISVCGEASLGKSQFINALIGKNILPVNEHSTTSQVFRVTWSEKESYTLFFEDGSSEPLNDASEVAHYGTELEKNIGDERIKGRVLKYIEVKTPGKYLIPGVSFYDTPGLGSLHFSHDDITLNCLEESDAVLFFCSTDRPFITAEFEFLNKAYRRTDNVLFIQSMADMYDDEVREEIADTNRAHLIDSPINELIQNKYDRTADFKFYPLSSLNLIKSATGDISYESAKSKYKYSYFEELKEAIELLAFRTVDYSSSLVAYNELCPYYEMVVSSIKNENDQLQKKTQAEREQYEDDLVKRKKEFEEKFGENSAHQQEIKEDFEAIFNNIHKNATAFYGKDGYLEKQINSQLYYFPEDLSEIKDFSDSVNSLIRQTSDDEWNDIVNYAKESLASICANFNLEMNQESFQNNRSINVPMVSISFDSNGLARLAQQEQERRKKIRDAKIRNAAISLTQLAVRGIGWLASYFAQDTGPAIVAEKISRFLDAFKVEEPETLLLPAPERDYAQIRKDFSLSVMASLENLRKHFLGFDGNSGLTGDLINAFQKDANNLIRKEVEDRRNGFDKELLRLKDNVHLSEKQAEEKIKTNTQLLGRLEDIGAMLKVFGNELNNLKSFYNSLI